MSQWELKGISKFPFAKASPARWFWVTGVKPALLICTGLPVLSAPVVISSACNINEKAPVLFSEFTTYSVLLAGSITGVPMIPALPLMSTQPAP